MEVSPNPIASEVYNPHIRATFSKIIRTITLSVEIIVIKSTRIFIKKNKWKQVRFLPLILQNKGY